MVNALIISLSVFLVQPHAVMKDIITQEKNSYTQSKMIVTKKSMVRAKEVWSIGLEEIFCAYYVLKKSTTELQNSFRTVEDLVEYCNILRTISHMTSCNVFSDL